MPSKRVNKHLTSGTYFITLTVVNWQHALAIHKRWQIIADSLSYFRKNKGLSIFAFVFMTNHIHLIINSQDTIGFIRDFKRFTTQQMKTSIQKFEPELMQELHSKDKFRFWQNTNMPLLIGTERFFKQKRDYIEMNPVRKGYVDNPHNWYWSSANDKCTLGIDQA